ncbi:response regulator [Microcoleus vaginatus GB1-A2]|uniref:ATP-binding response regulator n=1 Tax=Microcoleus vaginatus TaxID=119532 RepID=UPI0016831C93|nr:response regulator [Microcoleus sp. FACHB-61]
MSKILVIEDDENIRGNIAEILEDEGWEVIQAEHGAIGVKRARESLPQLIVCDVMMPELDGYEVLAALRQDMATTTIPFILLTAKADKSDIRLGMNLGADDYLTKPFKREELIEAVKVRLQKREAIAKQSEQKLDELRSNLTRSLPHELLTPLNGIISYSQLLKEDYAVMDSEEIREMLESIHTSGKRLYRLTQNYLLYANLEILAADPQKIEFLQSLKVDFPKAIIEPTAIYQAEHLNRSEDLSLEVTDVSIQIVENNLKKVVEELVNNAFKFSEPGTPVRVEGRADGSQFVLSVCDRGRGMTAEQIASVGAYTQFERKIYEQQGSGLGLTIAHRIAELHGGKLEIESIPEKETIVRLFLSCAGKREEF